eukprot:TRINITY_DN11315_c0_g1_i1.p2 TRINITY_DN11315_c0_g1~~TRINITY_DN11315_c0_g1_i1.p2  ORF type:complete len:131 (+),score=7.99 TRINITY_DN11315_c0_g1_i1:75-467(+)
MSEVYGHSMENDGLVSREEEIAMAKREFTREDTKGKVKTRHGLPTPPKQQQLPGVFVSYREGFNCVDRFDRLLSDCELKVRIKNLNALALRCMLWCAIVNTSEVLVSLACRESCRRRAEGWRPGPAPPVS